jgi:acetyl esterase/lipase
MAPVIRRTALPIVLVVLLGACANETASSPTTTVAETTSTTCAASADQTDVAYGADPLQRLDLSLPEGAGCPPVPVVVWVHGGGWQIGDKSNAMTAKVALWNDAGWAVASVNYRLTDPSVPAARRVVAPSHNEDVAAAVGWLTDNATDVGIDPTRIALLGHSAGAGIVAALATDPTYLEAVGLQPTDLACVAPLDTEAFSIADAVESGAVLADIYGDAFGTDPQRWEDLSPLTHVGDAPTPPLFLVTRGTDGRRAIVATFAAAVDAAGGETTIVDLPGFSHEDVNKRIGDPNDDELTPALQEFLSACLAR